MNRKTLAGALALMMLGLSVPALGYHIDNTRETAIGELSSGDIETTPIGFLVILCELEFGAGGGKDANGNPVSGIAADDRIGTPADDASLPGFGGLCTTGRNDATGTPAPTSEPDDDEWTRLDVCDIQTGRPPSGSTSDARNGDYGPYLGGGNACTGGVVDGNTDTWAWIARMGAFQCVIPTAGLNVQPDGETIDAANDYAFYYNELYAWWTYDGNGSYTGTDAVNSPHAGDGAGGPVSQESAWHGHATVFLDHPNSDPATAAAEAPASAETTAFTEAGLTTHLNNAGMGVVNESDCGSSPGLNAVNQPMGPVFRAFYG